MADVTITNLTSEPVLLQELYIVLKPNEVFQVVRERDELHAMPALQQLWKDGIIEVDVVSDAAEDDFIDQKLHTVGGTEAALSEVVNTWSFETVATGVSYIGGFYEFASTDNDFSPSVAFGTAGRAIAAHAFVVTGAVPGGEVQITVTGVSITDAGVRTPADSEVITIPEATAVDSYFETSKKWNGQVTIETTAGTAITCNYGWSKYHDHGNRNFTVRGLEALWYSESTDSASDLALLHHKSTGWTFNGGAEPTPPTAIARRSTDHGAENDHLDDAPGAWKRADLDIAVQGAASEGIIVEVTSGAAGVGNQSFRQLTFEVTLRKA